MAIFEVFGLPGSGKTTMFAYLASKAVKGKKYKNVYGNVHMKIPGYTYIDNECIGKYYIADGIVFIDEATLFADNRRYKDLGTDVIAYLLQHRHFNVDMYFFLQQSDGIDKKIRSITDRVYYIYKSPVLGLWWSTFYRIPYGIDIPDKRKNESYGDIIQGYCKPHPIVRIFAKKLYRPKYYKYFDSFERYHLPPLPDVYKPYQVSNEEENYMNSFRSKLKMFKFYIKSWIYSLKKERESRTF